MQRFVGAVGFRQPVGEIVQSQDITGVFFEYLAVVLDGGRRVTGGLLNLGEKQARGNLFCSGGQKRQERFTGFREPALLIGQRSTASARCTRS